MEMTSILTNIIFFILKLGLLVVVFFLVSKVYKKINKNKIGHRSIKAMSGNFIYKLTGSEVWVDKEWNDRQMTMPDKKSWIKLVVVFPLALALLFLVLLLLFK